MKFRKILVTGKHVIVDLLTYNRLEEEEVTLRLTKKGYVNVYYYKDGDDKKTQDYLHRYVMNVIGQDGVIHHKNHDTLDNRCCNLEKISQSQNLYSKKKYIVKENPKKRKSIYKGVTPVIIKSGIKWKAVVVKNREAHYCGLFSDEKRAAEAYNVAARIIFGRYAVLNIIRENEAQSIVVEEASAI